MIWRSPIVFCAFLYACSRGGAERDRAQSLQSDSLRVSASTTTPASSSDTGRRSCSEGVGSLYISEDCIGPLHLGMTVAALKAAFPHSRDTVLYGQESVNPAVRFPLQGLTVLAVQHEDSLIPRHGADVWSVSGSDGLLLGQVPLSARWAEFRAAFGAGIVYADPSTNEHQVTVMFCSHPRLLFIVDASPDRVAIDDRSGFYHDLSRIPGTATLREIEIFPSPMADWSC